MKKIVWLFLLLGFPILLLAQKTSPEKDANWKLEKDKNGIRVYSRHLTDSKLKELKVNCDLNGTMSQLVAYICGIEYYTEVVYRSAEAYMVKQVSESEFYFYNRTDMPWPVSDRDLVLHIRFQMDPATRILSVFADDVSGMVPLKKEVVRVPHWRAVWTIRALDAKRLRVEYRFAVDPGGGLPAWLVNSLAAQGPYDSFSKMEEVLTRPYYQGKTYGFLAN